MSAAAATPGAAAAAAAAAPAGRDDDDDDGGGLDVAAPPSMQQPAPQPHSLLGRLRALLLGEDLLKLLPPWTRWPDYDQVRVRV